MNQERYENSSKIISNSSYKKNNDNYPLAKTSSLAEIEKHCLLNLSAVKLQTAKYKECIKLCCEVLALDKNNVKAIFRQGLANIRLNNYNLGLQYLKKAHNLAPKDKSIIAEIHNVEQLKDKYLAEEKKIFTKMFKN